MVDRPLTGCENTHMERPTLVQVAEKIRPIVLAAVRDLGADLQGSSVVDLVADNLPEDWRIGTGDIKSALVVAGVDRLLSARLVRSYSLA